MLVARSAAFGDGGEIGYMIGYGSTFIWFSNSGFSTELWFDEYDGYRSLYLNYSFSAEVREEFAEFSVVDQQDIWGNFISRNNHFWGFEFWVYLNASVFKVSEPAILSGESEVQEWLDAQNVFGWEHDENVEVTIMLNGEKHVLGGVVQENGDGGSLQLIIEISSQELFMMEFRWGFVYTGSIISYVGAGLNVVSYQIPIDSLEIVSFKTVKYGTYSPIR